MKITLTSTTQMITVNGAPARVWKGETASGIPIFAAITSIAAHKSEDHSQFEAELTEHHPRAEQSPFPLRMVL